MYKLIDVFNTGDLRHLLIEYSEKVSIVGLLPFFDTIMIEFDELQGTSKYEESLHKEDSKQWKLQLINACSLAIYALDYPLYNKEQAQRLIDGYNLKIKLEPNKVEQKKAIEKLERKIKQIITTIEILKVQELEDGDNNKKVTWESLRARIHAGLNLLPEYDCTVAQYLAYDKQLNLLIAERKKQQANG